MKCNKIYKENLGKYFGIKIKEVVVKNWTDDV
jgi:hypothetical protein